MIDHVPSPTKTVKNNATICVVFRAKIHEAKEEDYLKVIEKHGLKYMNDPERVIRYIGGYYAKEHEWFGVSYYANEENMTAVLNCEERKKLSKEIEQFANGAPQVTHYTLKHMWE